MTSSEVSDGEKSSDIKIEEAKSVGNQQRLPVNDVKSEKAEDPLQLKAEGWVEGTKLGSIPSGPPTHEFRSGSMDSSSKVSRRHGKRKRR